MPLIDQHIKQAKHNEEFVVFCNPTASPYPDWIVTIIFYAAIHYIEAALAIKNKHSDDHASRENLIVHHIDNYNLLYIAHRNLKDRSRKARYNCISVAPAQIADAFVNLAKVKDILGPSLPQNT
jgi:hypothetical protein